jgi:flavin reductase (DIM6/NTAB) family NADH-FMN oxidoreductase RutF
MTVSSDEFREALGHWASGVTIVAFRSEGRVIATTVSAFLSLSLEPPLVLIALGPNATVLPFLQPGAEFGISILGASHRRLASVFADPFPVGASPFSDDVPLVPDALVGLACSVTDTSRGGDHTLVTAAVRRLAVGHGTPLLRYRRSWRVLEE